MADGDQPQVVNGSFEADAYRKTPGTTGANGGRLTGWRHRGNVGVNPVWADPQKRTGPTAPFHDNGRVPDGRQIGLLQGPGSLSQTIAGFRAGERWRVVYRENGRVQRRGTEWPRARVLLGGQEVVSPHEVPPVGRQDDFDTPFARVESAWFTVPADGPLELVIEAVQETATTTLLLDDVRLERARE